MTSGWSCVILFSAFYLVCSITAPQNIALKVAPAGISSQTGYDPSFSISNEHQTYTGKLKNVNGVNVIVYEGSYYLLHPNGLWQLVTYVADENGFVVKKFELKIPMYATINPKAVQSLLGG